MEKLELITTRPVPCDTAREECDRLYNDYRLCEHLGYVDFMLMAWRKARAAGYAEGYQAGYDAAISLALALTDRDAWKRLSEIERESDGDKTERRYPADHADDIGRDRYRMAREVNSRG